MRDRRDAEVADGDGHVALLGLHVDEQGQIPGTRIVAKRALGLGVTYQLVGQAELRVTRLAQFLSWLD